MKKAYIAMRMASISLLVLVGCGLQPGGTDVNDADFPQNPGQNLSGFGSAGSMLDAMLGNYGGTVFKFKGYKDEQSQPYTFTMSRSANNTEVGVLQFQSDGAMGSVNVTAALRVGMNGNFLEVDPGDRQPIYAYSFVSSKVTAAPFSEGPFSFEITFAMKANGTLVPTRSQIRIRECVLYSSTTCTSESQDVSFGNDLSKR